MNTTITLSLPPGLDAQVHEMAAHRGQSVEEYLLSLAEREAARLQPVSTPLARDVPPGEPLTWQEVIRRIQTGYRPSPDQQEQAFREFIRGIPTGVSLSDEDLRRESIYEDRV